MTTWGVILAVAMFVLFPACDDSDQVEMNIQQLRAAVKELRQNPQDKQALSVLVNQLSHHNGLYRTNAAAVLGEAAEQVGAAPIATEAVPALAKLLESDDLNDQGAAARALALFGEHARPALPVLKKRLTPSSRDVAWFSARAIGNIGPPAADAVPDLVRTLKEQVNGCSGYSSVCSDYFIPAIGKIGPPAKSATPDLEALLDHGDAYLRMSAAVALLGIDEHNQRASEEIAGLLKNPDIEVRYSTLTRLKQNARAARAVKPLVELAKQDAEADVRRRADELLRELN
jgi:HEAT repeat protein